MRKETSGYNEYYLFGQQGFCTDECIRNVNAARKNPMLIKILYSLRYEFCYVSLLYLKSKKALGWKGSLICSNLPAMDKISVLISASNTDFS